MLSISQFPVCKAKLYAGGAYFKSKIFGHEANTISVSFINGVLKISKTPSFFRAVIKKYDGVSEIVFDGDKIFVNGEIISKGNILSTSQNRIVFSDAETITPIVEIYDIDLIEQVENNQIISGYSLQDAQSKTAQSELIEMPTRPGPDITAQGADGTFLEAFEPSFMSGGSGLPPTAKSCDTGPFRTLAKVFAKEGVNGEMNSVDEMYEWDGPTKEIGFWRPY